MGKRSVGILVLASLVLCVGPGCYPVTGERAYCEISRLDPAIPVEHAKNVPMMRIGSLPHPFGPIPVNYADPQRLGQHRYRDSALRSIRLGEASAGIIYTRQTGFIDLAHTRNAGDLTWYAYERILSALLASRPRVLLAGAEPSVFILHLDYPEPWRALNDAARERLAERLAVVLAVRMGYVISTWHEVLTSFGYHGVPGIPEQQSAFMYDDQPSHRVGAVAAGRAILRVQSEGVSYEEAMTATLAESIARLAPLDTAGTRRAVEACRSQWWDTDGPTARQVHLGMVGERFEPIRIHLDHPEVLGGAADEIERLTPWAWEVPSLARLGAALPESVPWLPTSRIEIDPLVSFSGEVFAAAGLDGPWIVLDRDGPALKAALIARLSGVEPAGRASAGR
ncbi:MAG: DUF4056 domain-containing protein [Phycisphaerales bacterium JB063]